MIQDLQLKIADDLQFRQEDLTEELFDKVMGEEPMKEAKAYSQAVAVIKQQTANDAWFSQINALNREIGERSEIKGANPTDTSGNKFQRQTEEIE